MLKLKQNLSLGLVSIFILNNCGQQDKQRSFAVSINSPTTAENVAAYVADFAIDAAESISVGTPTLLSSSSFKSTNIKIMGTCPTLSGDLTDNDTDNIPVNARWTYTGNCDDTFDTYTEGVISLSDLDDDNAISNFVENTPTPFYFEYADGDLYNNYTINYSFGASTIDQSVAFYEFAFTDDVNNTELFSAFDNVIADYESDNGSDLFDLSAGDYDIEGQLYMDLISPDNTFEIDVDFESDSLRFSDNCNTSGISGFFAGTITIDDIIEDNQIFVEFQSNCSIDIYYNGNFIINLPNT